LIAQRGWTVYRVYSDWLSGTKEARPGLNALMAGAHRDAFDLVVVWRFDRFARSVKQLVLALDEFNSLGIDFISHQEALDTSTPMGRAMFTIIAAMAELERDVIREPTTAGLEYARQHGTKSGKPIGRPRAVFRRDQVLQLHGEGLSGREIARMLGLGGDTRGPSVIPSLLAAGVGSLDRGNLLIGDRNGRTAMPLFAHEIEFSRGRVATQTWLLQRRIKHFVSAVLNRSAGRGDLQSKKFPAVRVRKGCPIMLYHRFRRDQLQNCARGIFLVGHAVLEDPNGFLELFGIGVLNPRVSHFRHVEHAAKVLIGYHHGIGPKGYGRMFTSGQLNKHWGLRQGAGQTRTFMSSSNGCKHPIAVAPRIGNRNWKGEWSRWSGSCSKHWQK
jgi:DNA invertase Pin-like site-specific DNA recombinase